MRSLGVRVVNAQGFLRHTEMVIVVFLEDFPMIRSNMVKLREVTCLEMQYLTRFDNLFLLKRETVEYFKFADLNFTYLDQESTSEERLVF